ncbi:MAG TPA: ABC transporter permease, partial [Clostridia bacterium]|nr:ABC transporter permease [Clostridia bacterium]
AMITGVTASVSSFRDYLIELAKADAGDWHGAVFDLPSSRLDDLASNEAVESYEYIQNMGYSLIDDPANDYKPYIFIGGMSDGLTSRLPVNIIEGRLPENQNEILLPRHLATNGGFNCSLNERLELDLGYRFQDGTKLWQTTGYFHEDDGNPEEFTGTDKQEFIVVGFYERPAFESFSAAGYTALTLADSEDITSDVYIKLKNPKEIYDFMKTEFPDLLYTTNRDLLMYSGISNDSNFTDVMNGLSAILIGLIVFGSISLIYNAFRISINERTKQFGLLSSVGATRRQLSNTVLTEALILSLIGIPIGIFAGICGMALTFAFTKNLFNLFIAGSSITMKLSLYPLSIAASAAIGLLT